MFPVFHLIAGGPGRMKDVVGTVTGETYGSETWVGDGWIGYLKSGAKLIRGRWHRKGDLWEFSPEQPNGRDAVCAQLEWEILDAYWGERAEIVVDQARQWDKVRFQPTDAIRIQGPTGVWLKPVTDTDEDSDRFA